MSVACALSLFGANSVYGCAGLDFVRSPRSPSRAFLKNALSYFLRKVIYGAGAVREDEGPPLRAHSIRGFSTSAVFLQNWSVSQMLEASTWKSNSVFASFLS